jgi:plasmid maintenance system antidote protein VapI
MNNQTSTVASQKYAAATATHQGFSSLSRAPYNPGHLLDRLIIHLGLKNDAALSRALEITSPTISRMRHHNLPVSAGVLIRMHEVTNLSIVELRNLMDDVGPRFRVGIK